MLTTGLHLKASIEETGLGGNDELLVFSSRYAPE